MKDVLQFMDNLAEFLGSSEGQTIEEIRAELCAEMGEAQFLEAERKFLAFIEEQKSKLKNTHASDCAVHNEPAYPNGPCNCGMTGE
ncbi:MAG: hypothetical protein WC891_08675 [Actinomycetota bacterium]|jgi:hypothetical protein